MEEQVKEVIVITEKWLKTEGKKLDKALGMKNYSRAGEIQSYIDGMEQMLVLFKQVFDVKD